MRLVTTIYFSLLIITSIAQNNNKVDISQYKKGYVVTKNNEYKQGYLFEQDNSKHKYILFSSTKNDRPIVIGVNSIIEYGFFNGPVYELIPHENDSVFMERINRKEPFIYFYKINGTKKYYIKANEAISLLPSQKYNLQDSLLKAFQDCPTMQDQITYANNNKKRFENLCSLYDNCSNKRINRLKFGLYAGFISNNINFNPNIYFDDGRTYFEDIKYNNNYFTSVIGAYLDIPFLKNHNNWFFHPGVEISKLKYNFTIIDQNLYSQNNEELNLNIKYTSVLLFFRFNSLDKKLSIYTDVGPVISFLNVQEAKFEEEDTEIDELNNNLLGLGTSLGIEYPISKQFSLNVGLTGNYLVSNTNMPRVWNIGIVGGISF